MRRALLVVDEISGRGKGGAAVASLSFFSPSFLPSFYPSSVGKRRRCPRARSKYGFLYAVRGLHLYANTDLICGTSGTLRRPSLLYFHHITEEKGRGRVMASLARPPAPARSSSIEDSDTASGSCDHEGRKSAGYHAIIPQCEGGSERAAGAI